MRKALTWAVAGLAAITAVSSSAMAQSASRRQMEQDYNQSLRKGEPIQQQSEAPPMIPQQTAAAPLELYDQFPNQGTDQPDGNMGTLDFHDGESGWQVSTNLGPGLPVTGDIQVGKLAPQQAPPHYRRGP